MAKKKRVIVRSDGEKYASLQEAADAIEPGASVRPIKKALSGKLASAYGFRWKMENA